MHVSYDELELFADSRGFVFEPLQPKAFSNQKNAHIVISMPGVIKCIS